MDVLREAGAEIVPFSPLQHGSLPTRTEGVYIGGGLMALGRTLSTFEGETLPMFGLLPIDSRMQREALTIGYREVIALRDSPLMKAGANIRGHEFHWSQAAPPPPELAAYRLSGGDNDFEGFVVGSTLASYVHLNLAAAPEVARRFVVTRGRARTRV